MTFSQAYSIDENEMLLLIEIVLARQTSRHAWLSSPNFRENIEEMYTVHLPTTTEWNTYLKVIYHDFLLTEDDRGSLKPKDKLLYESNFSEISAKFSRRQQILIRITEVLMNETPIKGDAADKNEIVPQKLFCGVLESILAKSKDLIGNLNGGVFAINEMSAAAIGLGFTLTNLFVCLEQSLSKELTGYDDLSNFPVQTFFLKEWLESD